MKLPVLARFCTLLAVFAAVVPFALAQTFQASTLAGSPGSPGNVNGTGAAARFSTPASVAVDAAGNVFVGDTYNLALRKISPAGVVTTVASFSNSLWAIAVDAAGVVYLADAQSHVIRRFAADGSSTLVAGQSGTAGSANGNGGFARFNAPLGIALDTGGSLYVADTGNHTVRKITPAGDVTTVAGLAGIYGNVDGPAPLARFYSPGGVGVDAAGNLYLADRSNYTIRRISAAGEVTTLAGGTSGYYYNSPVDGTGSAARFGSLGGLSVDATGNVFVSEYSHQVIRRVTPAGVVTTILGTAGVSGSTDGVGASARFSSPNGLALDLAGNVYVADSGNQTIRKATFVPLPTVSSPPVAVTAAAGQNATFAVTATGGASFLYQWQRQAGIAPGAGFANVADGGAYSGATTASLVVTGLVAAMSGDQFRCVIVNAAGTVTSLPATLAVTSAPVVAGTGAATFYAGATGSYSVVAAGIPIPAFSLTSGTFPSWASLNASTGVISGTPSNTGGSPFSFTVHVTNALGFASQSVTITVEPPLVAPTVSLASARRQVVQKGQSLILAVTANGSTPLAYRWKRNGLPLAGATGATYTIANASAQDAGYYQAVVSNPVGTATAPAIFVNVSYPATEVISWGPNVPVPAGLTTAVAISAGMNHGVVLKSDGTVRAWGGDSTVTTIPAGLSGVVAVSGGYSHSLALKSDGTVVGWGYNDYSQLAIPPGLSDVVAIAAGGANLALKGDGTVVAWGNNINGLLSVPAGLTGVVAISNSGGVAYAITADGTITAWGDNSFGLRTIPATAAPALAVAPSYTTSLALKVGGAVVAWGSNYYGVGTVPAGLTGVTALGASSYQAVALKSDGSVVLWGNNSSDGGTVPFPVGVRSVVAISAGANLRLALRDASDDSAPVLTASPVGVAANLGQGVTLAATATAGTASLTYQWFKDTVAIAGATSSSYAINVVAASAGSYYVTASNSLGAVSTAPVNLSLNASPMVSPTTGGRYPLTVGQSLTLNLAASIGGSATVQWRRNGVALPDATSRSYAITGATLAQGGYYEALYNDGSGPVLSAPIFVPVVPVATQVLAWGVPGNYAPVPAGLGPVIAVSARGYTTLALKADGSLARWGNTSYNYQDFLPAGLTNIVAIGVGSALFGLLRSDGTVLSWAEDSYYYSNSVGPMPAMVEGLTNVVAISVGTAHGLALKNDGTVAAWGPGNTPAAAVPSGLSNVVAVSAGDGFSLALRADGTVVGWGRNTNGESAIPVGLTGVKAISAGSSFSLALKADGTVVAWGYNGSTQTLVPADLSDVVRIAAGDAHALALKADGTVVMWGSFSNSYYGTAPITVPAGLANVFDLDGGSSFSVVVREATADTAPLVVTPPAGVSAFSGQSFTLQVAATSGTAPLAYQWRKSGSAIPGATNPSLRLPTVAPSQGGSYDVVLSNYLGFVTSDPAVVTVNPTAGATASPAGRVALAAGQSLALTGASALPGAVTYQWRRTGQPVPGATSANYSVSAATWAHGGVYQLVATNAVGPAVSAPVFVSVADGVQVRAWGDNTSGQASLPAGLGSVVSVAAGNSHSLALRGDGTVVAWGGNAGGATSIPAGLANVVSIAAGSGFSMALLANGTVSTWGSINYTPAGLTGVLAIAAGASASYAMALRSDSTVVVWSSGGVLANGPPGLGEVVGIASGGSALLALRADGTVVQWYYGDTTPVVVPSTLTNVVAISYGGDHGLALKADGTVAGWSGNTSTTSSYLTVPSGLTGVTAVVAGYAISYARKSDGTIVTWGSGSYYSSSPGILASGAASLAPALMLSAGYGHTLGLRDPSGDTAPVIAAQSPSQSVTVGQPLTLSVNATGVPVPIYQWYRNGFPLSGSTSATLAFTSTSASSAGTYTVTVSNGLGSVTSGDIVVVVNPTLAERGLLTGSTHATAGAFALTGTFTIEGTVSKLMLIRGVGPALATFGVTDVLADPQLTITSATGALVTTNDNWAVASNVSQVFATSAQVGAFALPAGGKDAAVLRSFAPGTYHVRLTGAAGTGGVALLEIYDAESTPRTVYLAATAFAGSGNNAFIHGFNLSGAPAGRSYLIRALGPTLNTPGALADPRLAVFNADGTPLAANDDWSGDSALAALAASVGAMPIPNASKDAALNFTPPAGGTFTLKVSGPGSASGLVLVEIFEVDAQRASASPAAIVAPPQPITVVSGQPATFGIVSIGRPAPTYQWRKNGTAIADATTATLTLAATQLSDAADYTVVATNAGGSATSTAVALTLVTQLATHTVVGHGYVAGSTASVTNTLTYSGVAAGLGWEIVLPAGWSYAGGSGEGDVKPAVGATGTLGWSWTTPPASPLVFTYVLNVPAGETAVRTLAATALVRNAATPTLTAPVPLMVAAAPVLHHADTNRDLRLGLTELTRVIELYNTRNGTARTGAYAVATTTTEDGFVADQTRAPEAEVALATYYTADSTRDGRLSLFELTRVIELYNVRSGTTRTGAYHVQGGTEDGFAPGP